MPTGYRTSSTDPDIPSVFFSVLFSKITCVNKPNISESSYAQQTEQKLIILPFRILSTHEKGINGIKCIYVPISCITQ